MSGIDDVVMKYVKVLGSIYEDRTAGAYTWEGVLGAFVRELEPVWDAMYLSEDEEPVVEKKVVDIVKREASTIPKTGFSSSWSTSPSSYSSSYDTSAYKRGNTRKEYPSKVETVTSMDLREAGLSPVEDEELHFDAEKMLDPCGAKNPDGPEYCDLPDGHAEARHMSSSQRSWE